MRTEERNDKQLLLFVEVIVPGGLFRDAVSFFGGFAVPAFGLRPLLDMPVGECGKQEGRGKN